MTSKESVKRWFHQFSRMLFVEKRFWWTVALDEALVKMYSLRIHVWSAVDVYSMEFQPCNAS